MHALLKLRAVVFAIDLVLLIGQHSLADLNLVFVSFGGFDWLKAVAPAI